jgi:uncharacterized protein YbdZ (MbtH family)
MPNTDKSDLPAGEGSPEEGTPGSLEGNAYFAAVNDAGQYAMWQANLALPAGWRQRSAAMPRDACLAAIAAVWPDIAPAGVRRARRETEGAGASTYDARAAYAIAHGQARASGLTYHLASPKHALLGSLVDRLRNHGFPVSAIPYREWVDELLRNAARNPAHPMTPFVPLFVERCGESDLTVAEMYLENIFPAYTRSNTEQALSGSGIVFPPVDNSLLDLTIGRLIATRYLRNPRETAASLRPGESRGP